VLRIDGEVDAYAAPQICQRVLDLACNGIVHAIADLRGAGFLDSAGLGALAGSRTGLRARGGSLTLVASTDRHWQAAVAGEDGSTEEWCRKHRLR
jgi:anti-anti-sigma factor